MGQNDPIWMKSLKFDPATKEDFLAWLDKRHQVYTAGVLAAVQHSSMEAAQRYLGQVNTIAEIAAAFTLAEREAVELEKFRGGSKI